MSPRQLLASLAFSTLLTIGCTHHHAASDTKVTNMNRPAAASPQRQADNMEDLVLAVMRAPTPAAEADAIRRLHKYETDHGLTYAVRTLRTYDNATVESSSVGNQPVRADVTIYRGRDVVRTFSFVPQDNRNLALMGE